MKLNYYLLFFFIFKLNAFGITYSFDRLELFINGEIFSLEDSIPLNQEGWGDGNSINITDSYIQFLNFDQQTYPGAGEFSNSGLNYGEGGSYETVTNKIQNGYTIDGNYLKIDTPFYISESYYEYASDGTTSYSGIDDNILSFDFSDTTNIFSLVHTANYDPNFLETVYSLDLSNENPDSVQIGIFIPEPSTYALILGAVAFVFNIRRRK